MTRTSGSIGFSPKIVDRWADDKGVFASRFGNVGMRILQGRCANTAYSAEATYELLIETAQQFDAIRFILAQADGTEVTASGTFRCVADSNPATAQTRRGILKVGGAQSFTFAAAAKTTPANIRSPTGSRSPPFCAQMAARAHWS